MKNIIVFLLSFLYSVEFKNPYLGGLSDNCMSYLQDNSSLSVSSTHTFKGEITIHITSAEKTESVIDKLNEVGEKIEYILESITESKTLLQIIKDQTNLATVKGMMQVMLNQQSQKDLEKIIKFLNVAIQTQDVRNMTEFEAIQEGIENLNKPSSSFEAKIKISIPFINLLGIDIGLEGKLDLKKTMKNIVQKTEELAVKHGINY